MTFPLSPKDDSPHVTLFYGEQGLKVTGTNSTSSENVIIDVLKRKTVYAGSPEAQTNPEGSEPVAASIPEIDDLEQRLAAVPDGDIALSKAIIVDWIKKLNGSEWIKPLDRKGQPRRRYTKEVEADEIAVRQWVSRLLVAFKALSKQTTHLSQAERDYGIEVELIGKWKKKGLLEELGREKNRIFINDQEIAIAATISHKFGRHGSSLVKVAMEFYKSAGKDY